MNKSDQNKTVKHSDPIAIHPAGFRRRSASIASSSSSGSGSSPETPGLFSSPGQHVTIPSPSNSPILSYFLGQSPTKTPATAATTYPFRKPLGTAPVFEEEPESQVPVAAHARRASAVVPGRLLQNPPLPDPHHERGTNLLRRLSLSTPVTRPNFTAQSANVPTSPVNNTVPPNTATTPTGPRIPSPRGKPSRSATISVDGRKPRSPSPMGERILKGHFDSFH